MVSALTLNVQPDPQALAVAAADLIAGQVRQKPDLSILVATGNTPMLTYAELARRVKAGEADFSRVTAVQLDEYLDIDEHDPRSLWAWMERSFVKPLGIRKTLRLQTPEQFEAAIQALGGLDLAILGLGPNGHLGFNEPPSPPDAPTRTLALTPESLESNRAYWGELGVPTRAITAGMDVILAARQTLLLVSGAHKRGVLHAALHGPETPNLPASFPAPHAASPSSRTRPPGLERTGAGHRCGQHQDDCPDCRRMDGTVLGAGRAGSCNIYVSEADSLSAIQQAAQQAMLNAGLDTLQLQAVVLSAAGADWPEDFTLLDAALEGWGWAERFQTVNDAVGALRAGSLAGLGVAVVCGTSAGTAARNAAGQTWHSSYWQEPEGAEDLARQALRAVYRAELGLDAPTSLTARVLAEFGCP